MLLCVWFQGLPGTPGLQGAHGPPGDPGETVSEGQPHFRAGYSCYWVAHFVLAMSNAVSIPPLTLNIWKNVLATNNIRSNNLYFKPKQSIVKFTSIYWNIFTLSIHLTLGVMRVSISINTPAFFILLPSLFGSCEVQSRCHGMITQLNTACYCSNRGPFCKEWSREIRYAHIPTKRSCSAGKLEDFSEVQGVRWKIS